MIIDDFSLDHNVIQITWNKISPMGANILAWRTRLGRHPTRLNIECIGLNIVSTICSLCNIKTENEKHIFIECSTIKQVRVVLNGWSGIPNTADSIQQLFEADAGMQIARKVQSGIMVVLLALLWVIWHCRNDYIFNNKTRNSKDLASELKFLAYNWMKIRARKDFINRLNQCYTPKTECSNGL